MEEATENTTVNKGIDSSAKKSDNISICSKDSINAMDMDTASEEINSSTGLAERGPDGSSVFRVREAFRKGACFHSLTALPACGHHEVRSYKTTVHHQPGASQFCLKILFMYPLEMIEELNEKSQINFYLAQIQTGYLMNIR